MQLHTIDTGFFKLDGGAMFGVVPKRMWQKLNPPDENNLCTWAMRCLLLQYGDKKVLIDTGMGDKQGEKFRSHFEPHGTATLLTSLATAQVAPEDVTDVILTHLHFDHCGGAVSRLPDGSLVPTFPNATYWSDELHWEWALDPNPREQASFLKENMLPLQEHNVLQFIPYSPDDDYVFDEVISLRRVHGHTESMMIPIIKTPTRKIYYTADLIPSSHHLGLPYVMGYDLRPLYTIEEKKRLLREAFEQEALLFFEHDPVQAVGKVQRDESGRFVIGDVGDLHTFL